MNHEDLAFTPLHEQARLITRGDVSPVELTEIYLDRISDYDEALGAYLAVTADRALYCPSERYGFGDRRRPSGFFGHCKSRCAKRAVARL